MIKKIDLRNSENPLLRRLQRKIDIDNEKILESYTKAKKVPIFKEMENFKGQLEPEECFALKKNTRFNLYNKRGRR